MVCINELYQIVQLNELYQIVQFSELKQIVQFIELHQKKYNLVNFTKLYIQFNEFYQIV